jgi:hypothetical protein
MGAALGTPFAGPESSEAGVATRKFVHIQPESSVEGCFGTKTSGDSDSGSQTIRRTLERTI